MELTDPGNQDQNVNPYRLPPIQTTAMVSLEHELHMAGTLLQICELLTTDSMTMCHI